VKQLTASHGGEALYSYSTDEVGDHLMQKQKFRSGWRRVPLLAIAASCASLTLACGGQMPFAGQIKIAGDPPPLPPPPPPPKVEKPPSRVEVRDNKIEIREKIQFEQAKATIKTESHDLLNEIVSVIKDNPHIKKIAIEGHASSDGNKAFNKKLSDDRSKSVRQYLIEHGIEEDRLTAKGYGDEKPIADNETEEGREKNRRVEFNIVEQEVTKKKVEIDASGKEKVLEKSQATEKKQEAEPEDDAKKDKRQRRRRKRNELTPQILRTAPHRCLPRRLPVLRAIA
jgi:outer membrane protein OmpA-like peptidoglycan-associated protein